MAQSGNNNFKALILPHLLVNIICTHHPFCVINVHIMSVYIMIVIMDVVGKGDKWTGWVINGLDYKWVGCVIIH